MGENNNFSVFYHHLTPSLRTSLSCMLVLTIYTVPCYAAQGQDRACIVDRHHPLPGKLCVYEYDDLGLLLHAESKCSKYL